MDKHHVFIWSPYSGQAGEKRFIEMKLSTLQEAINFALDKREAWRGAYGEGQVIIATVSTYLGLH